MAKKTNKIREIIFLPKTLCSLCFSNFLWLILPKCAILPIIPRLRPPKNRKLSVYFNADYEGTGKRLSPDWIKEIKRVWNLIKINSNGEIPEEGEVYVFNDTDNTGVSNITKKNSDGSVYEIILFFNSEFANKGQIEGESIDSLFNGEQNMGGKRFDWVKYCFSRPAGDNYGYRIYEDHEEENGFTEGISGTINRSASIKIQSIPKTVFFNNKSKEI